MSSVPPSGLEDIVGARGRSATGFEIAHFAGQDQFEKGLDRYLSIGKDSEVNLRPLPNRSRGSLALR